MSFAKEEYPAQALQIRDVLLCLVRRIGDELERILAGAPQELDFDRARTLASYVYDLHSYVRYLRASSPRHTPPGIQFALAELTKHFFPARNGTPLCLVRPQWSYNLGYLDLSTTLEDMIQLHVLNPTDQPHTAEKRDLLPALWELQQQAKTAKDKAAGESQPYPNQLAVLSFARLDTDDVLLYPMLAHELGHFIDYSFRPRYLHLKNELYEAAAITLQSVQTALNLDQDSAEECYQQLLPHAYICLREIIADLLAARMMGFSFFVAQAEYLKRLSAWPGRTIEPSGYPGIKFRLSIVCDYLRSLRPPYNIGDFLRQHEDNEHAAFLLSYLGGWMQELEDDTTLRAAKKEPANSPQLFLENAIRSALPAVYKIVDEVMRDRPCARLTDSFFSRIINLTHDLPPSCESENDNSIAEIFSAAWAYRLKYGEARQENEVEQARKGLEYNKTCNLVLKAIELIPFAPTGVQPKTAVNGTTPQRQGVPPDVSERPHGVLGKRCLLARMALPVSNKSSIKVVPFKEAALNPVSLDLRLGNWFSVARKARLSCFTIEADSPERTSMFVRESTFTPQNERFVIHPGDLVLGTTLEFLALPGNVMAYVEGKSKIGRKGLIIATASKIDPGFHGVLVLELVNAGTVPIEISPGCVIAQLVFQGLHIPLEGDDLYHGEFYCQIKPM